MSEQRELAMMHIAMHDALNAIRPVYEPYAGGLGAHPNASPDAAVAAAAHDVLVATVPDKQADLDTTFANALARVPTGAARDEGVQLGHDAARTILALRANDGSNRADVADMPQPGIGKWETTAPNHLKALMPGWEFVTPFALASANQFLPPPPPCRGKSGLHRARCQVTPGRREPTESATERNRRTAGTAPRGCVARVKRCGKSAPRAWQRAGTANPTGSKAK
jgi:hypothetical protein